MEKLGIWAILQADYNTKAQTTKLGGYAFTYYKNVAMLLYSYILWVVKSETCFRLHENQHIIFWINDKIARKFFFYTLVEALEHTGAAVLVYESSKFTAPNQSLAFLFAL